MSLITEQDLYLFNEGSHFKLYDKLGAHLMEQDGKKGVSFAVWAPNARKVSVIGDFNQWNKTKNPLRSRASSGIWEGFIPGLEKGFLYILFVMYLQKDVHTQRYGKIIKFYQFVNRKYFAYQKDRLRAGGDRLIYLVFVYEKIFSQYGDRHILPHLYKMF